MVRWPRVLILAVALALVASVVSVADVAVLPTAAATPQPPAAVVPTRAVQVTTTPGPTTVSSNISADTVWGPSGSPYLVTQPVAVAADASLTVLPGTEIQMGWDTQITVVGQIQMLGTKQEHVTVTGTTQVPGSWRGVKMLPGLSQTRVPLSVFDYVDFSYGGKGTDSACRDSGMVSVARHGRAVVTNSTFRHAQYVALSDGASASSDGFFGVYRNTFGDSYCGVANWGGKAEYLDNTFEDSFTSRAFISVGGVGRFWFNEVNGYATVAYDEMSVRYNYLEGVSNFGAWSQQLQDWRYNEWEQGLRPEPVVPPCADPATFDEIQPPVVSFSDLDCAEDHPFPQWYGAHYRLLVEPGAGDTRHVPASLIRPYHGQFNGVDTTDGTLSYSVDDLTVEDAGAQIDAGRNYSSSSSRDLGPSDVGRGWRTTYSEGMTPQGSPPAMTLSDDGSVPLSDPTNPTVYPGVAATLTTSSQGAEVSTPDHTTYEFDSTGQLTGMLLGDSRHRLDIDRAGGKVSRVTGVSGRNVEYLRSGGNVSGFEDSAGRDVAFDYDTQGRLVSATGVDGQGETYEYDGSSARLTRVVSAEGVARLAAGYDGSGRVAWVEPEGSGRFTIAYDSGSKRTITQPDGVDVVQTLDDEGRLVSEQVEGGSGRHLIYDGDGRMVAEVSGVPTDPMTGYSAPSTATLIDVGDGAADVKWIELDPLGRATVTTLNGHQDPTQVIGPDGSSTSYSYNSHHRVSELTDPRGETWELTYGQYGQIESITDPAGRDASWGYQSDGDLESTTSFVGGTTDYSTNSRGLVTETVDPAGASTQLAYTNWGAVASVTTPRGGVTTATFDDDRRVTAVEDPEGGTVEYHFDARGRISRVDDPLNQPITLTYDDNGRPESRTDANDNTFTQTYTPEGWTAQVDGPEETGSTTEYDPAGRAVWVVDGLGHVTQTVYDRAGQVVRIDTPDGGHRSWTYDGAGRPLKYTDALNRNTQYQYNAAGDLTKTTDPEGGIETRTYDGLGRVTSVTDPSSHTVTSTYSNAGRTTTVSDSIGQRSQVSTDTLGRVISEEDGLGHATDSTYNPDGLLASRTAPGQPAVTYAYDLAGHLTGQTDERGHTIEGTYDAVGRLTERVYPDGTAEGFGYDAVGNLTELTDRAGQDWTYEFDGVNRVTSASDPLEATTEYDYDALGNLVETVDPTGVSVTTTYDPMDRPAVITDSADNSTVKTYDPEGNLLTTTDPGGRVVTNKYDKLDRLTNRSYSGVLGTMALSWDSVGNLLSIASDGKTFSWSYDARDRVVASVDALGSETSYQYDLADRVVQKTMPSGRDFDYSYTVVGDPSSITVGGRMADYSYFPGSLLKRVSLPSGAHYDFVYDEMGQLVTQTDPEQLQTLYGYEDGRLSEVSRPDQSTISYSYDDAGRLTSQSASGSTRAYDYDAAGRMTSATTSGAGGSTSVAMTYNGRGLLATSTDAAGTTTYTHDAAGYLATVAPPSGGSLDFTYNAVGDVATVRGPVNLNYGYDKWGRLTSRSQQSGTTNAGVSFKYDKNGHPTEVSAGSKQTASYDVDGLLTSTNTDIATATNAAEGTQTFSRDSSGRLTGSTLTSSAGSVVSESTYAWDDDSNRSSVEQTVPGTGMTTLTATHDDAGRLQTVTDGQDTTAYTYDDNGALTSIDLPGSAGDTTYAYDGFGDLVSASVTQSGGSTADVDYTRDALGRVVDRTQTGGTSPGTTAYGYRATSTEPSSLSTGSGVTSLIRDSEGVLLAAKAPGGAVSHAVPNLHGDLMAWRAQSGGAVTHSRVYDPFGVATTTSTSGTPGAELGIGFQSQATDPLTGLVEMGARVYDPTAGAFTTPDTWVGDLTEPVTLNRYTYGNASPLDFADPTGHFSIPLLSNIANWIRSAVSGVTSSIASGVSHVVQGAAQAANQAWAATRAAYAQAKSFQTQLASRTRELAGGAQAFVSDFRGSLSQHSTEAHVALAALGMVFDPADAIDGACYLLIDHDVKQALISFGSMVPVAGAFVALGRGLRKADEAAELTAVAARLVDDEAGVATRFASRETRATGEVVDAAAATRRIETNAPLHASPDPPPTLTAADEAANGADEGVSIYKASQPGLTSRHLTEGYKPEDFPGSAFFTRDKAVAEHWGQIYGEGHIETRMPKSVFDEHLAQHEWPYPGWPGMTELEAPSDLLDLISSFPRTLHN